MSSPGVNRWAKKQTLLLPRWSATPLYRIIDRLDVTVWEEQAATKLSAGTQPVLLQRE